MEARKIWARFAKGRGCSGFCLWTVWPLTRTCTLPLEDLPGCFQWPVCKHSDQLVPQARHCASVLEKSALGLSPLRAKGPEPVEQLGAPNTQAKA